jgi:membrane protease YdiL (CAAX protease family)
VITDAHGVSKFGLLHGQWLAGTLAGMLYAGAAVRGRQLWIAVVAHATTNLMFGVYVFP